MKNLRSLKNIGCLRNRFVDGILWFTSTSRNALAVIAGGVAAYLLEINGLKPFTLTGYLYNKKPISKANKEYFTFGSNTGDIKAGLPPFEIPPFSINRTVDSNSTEWISFPEICSELGASIGLIPLIAILEQVAIAKTFGKFPSLQVPCNSVLSFQKYLS